MKNIVILGVTGSIGQSTLKVVRHLSEKFNIIGVAGGRRWQDTAKAANEFNVPLVCTANETDLEDLQSQLHDTAEALHGEAGLVKMCTDPRVDMVLCGIVGVGGLIPVYEAIKKGKDIALASKEILVAAGEIIMDEAHKSGSKIIPVDSEHCAIFQCLESKRLEHISRAVLTCSGGPFLRTAKEDFKDITVAKALKHPTWEMGQKITIDSASLMNKALEVIEARWLFDLQPEQVDVVIHPQSIVHSMVEFTDGTVLAQMSENDMVFPIQYALTYPERYEGSLKPMDFTKAMQLNFEGPDKTRFPSLDFAYRAMREGGASPAILNAVNEVAALAFIKEEIAFTQIWELIEYFLDHSKDFASETLEDIIATDRRVREMTRERILKG